MKTMYWQRRKATTRSLVAVMLLAVAGWGSVEAFPTKVEQPFQSEKLAAAQQAEAAMDSIRRERLRRGHTFDLEFDPAQSGMIGELATPTTTVSGHLISKQTSVNPNFAAVVVQMLKEAGVKRGDCVAVGCSGSFPAINLAVYSAMESMELEPLVVSSVGASQFGANLPDFTWLDMERLLYEEGHISFRSAAATYGGYADSARGLTEQGRTMIDQAIERNGIPLLDTASLDDGIIQRMRAYDQAAGDRPIKAYVNVGGGASSVGAAVGKRLWEPGVTLEASPHALLVDSVMTRFASRDSTPIVHLIHIKSLAEEYGLPVAPALTPSAGTGGIFVQQDYNRLLAVLVLLLVTGGVQLFVVTDLGYRLANSAARNLASSRDNRQPAPQPQAALAQQEV